MSFGNTLRMAREACGITTSELAARTHMLVQIVEGLENEDFRRIPAPIYGRGFIKLYCEAVNIDPKPLQAEFMELFNRPKGSHADPEPRIKRAAPSAPSPESPSATVETAPQIDVENTTGPIGDLFERQPLEPPQRSCDIASASKEQSADTPVTPPPKRSYGDIFGQTYADDDKRHGPSAAEKFRDTMSNVSSGVFSNVQKLPRNTGRIVAVSLCAALMIGFIAWGVFALYMATSPVPVDSSSTSDTVSEKVPDAKTDKPKTGMKAEDSTESAPAKTTRSASPGRLKSSGIEIPTLYID